MLTVDSYSDDYCCRLPLGSLLSSSRARETSRGKRGGPYAVRVVVAEVLRPEVLRRYLRACEQRMHVVLPGEADSAVPLDSVGPHLPGSVRGRRLRQRPRPRREAQAAASAAHAAGRSLTVLPWWRATPGAFVRCASKAPTASRTAGAPSPSQRSSRARAADTDELAARATPARPTSANAFTKGSSKRARSLTRPFPRIGPPSATAARGCRPCQAGLPPQPAQTSAPSGPRLPPHRAGAPP
jgi:hypothetical protein